MGSRIGTGGRARTGLVVSAILTMLLGITPASASDDGGDWELPDELSRTDRDAPRSVSTEDLAAFREVRSRPRPPVRAMQSQPQPVPAGLSWFNDRCDDASRMDLAKYVVGEAGTIVHFVWLNCPGSFAARDGDEYVMFAVDTLSHGHFFPMWIAAQDTSDGYYELIRTNGAENPAYWHLVDEGYGEIGESRWGSSTGMFTVNAEKVDFPTRYRLGVGAMHGETDLDRAPDDGGPYPVVPNACAFEPWDATVVVADRSRMDPLVRALRDEGHEVTARAPGLGSFSVSSVSDDQLAALDGMDGVSADRPTMLESLAVRDPEPTQWALDLLRVEDAWRVRRSAPVQVAVIDDGVDAGRADLAGRVGDGWDLAYDRRIPAHANSTMGGHGTAVAGVLAAKAGNDLEVTGVNDAAIVHPYAIFDHGGCAQNAWFAAALDRITARSDIRLVNMSIGTPIDDPLVRAAVRRAAAAGKIMIAATGNDGATSPNTASYPAAYPEVIGVGAIGPGPQVAPYSQQHATEIVAPGGDTRSADGGVSVLAELRTVAAMQGTSFAAPYVTGVLSLWLADDPHATLAQVRTALEAAAVDIPGTNWDGHGTLDAARLLQRPDRDRPPVTIRTIDRSCPPGRAPSSETTDAAGTAHERSIHCALWWEVASTASSGRFAPNEPVTRGVMADWIARLIDATGGDLPQQAPDRFSDTHDSPYRISIARIAAAGVVDGYSDGTFRPQQPVTRAQMATFVASAHRFAAGQVLGTSSDDRFWDDTGNVHERAINRVASMGVAGGTAVGVYSPNARIGRGQMASFLARLLDIAVEQGRADPPG